MAKTTRKTSAETSIVTGTLRSHPWHDHSFRRVSRMIERSAPGYLECRVLEAGRFSEKPALTSRGSAGHRDSMMCDLLAIMSPAWGEPHGLPLVGVNG